jgi:hypothetical protein
MLRENEKGIVDQAIWGLGNLSADKTIYRDDILSKGGMETLINIITNATSKTTIRNGTWSVTNLCRG